MPAAGAGPLERLDTIARLWRHPRASREELIQFQNRKLRLLVAHAFANVPHYRRRFDEAGIRPSDIRSVADLARLPVTTKADLRNQPLSDIVARGVDPRRLILRYTAGSTGEPTRVRRTAFEDLLLNLFRVRTLNLLGRRVSDRIAKIGSYGGPTDKKPDAISMVPGKLGLYKSWPIDALRAPSEVARDLARIEPDVIQAYPGVLTEVAALWPTIGRGRRPPRLVFPGGEVMPPAMRKRIAEGLRTRVFDTYGSHECNMLGWECPVSGLIHVCDDSIIMEVIRAGAPAGPGESGEVWITVLHTYSVPYIRYCLGDIVNPRARSLPMRPALLDDTKHTRTRNGLLPAPRRPPYAPLGTHPHDLLGHALAPPLSDGAADPEPLRPPRRAKRPATARGHRTFGGTHSRKTRSWNHVSD